MRKTTRRELTVAAGATAYAAAVPPAWGRLTSRRVGIGPGEFLDGVAPQADLHPDQRAPVVRAHATADRRAADA